MDGIVILEKARGDPMGFQETARAVSADPRRKWSLSGAVWYGQDHDFNFDVARPPYDGVLGQVHVFSPSVGIDLSWLPVKERAASMQGSSFHSEWGEKALNNILDEQRDKIN